MIGDNADFEFEEDENWDSMEYIDDMQSNSRGLMMDVVYSSIVNNEYNVVNSLTSNSKKIEAIYHVLLFFEKGEDYEKCAKLKKIIDKIK
jgi:enterochelin esterase-like enzyme